MNVLVIGHTYIAPINRDKWKSLVEHHADVDLTVVVPTTWPTHLFTHHAGDLSIEQQPRLRFIALPTWFAGNEVRYAYQWHDLARLLCSVKPDVIHVEQGDNAWSYCQTILLTKLLGLRSRFCFFTWVNWKPALSLKYRMTWGLIERFNRWFSDGAIVGNHDAQVILQDKGFKRNVVVAPQLGVNEKVFGGEPHSFPYHIGFIGRITHEKGVILLLQAFHHLMPAYPTWNLRFVGNGPAKHELIDYVQRNNLANRVIFNDPVSHHEVANVFNALAIFVLPSYDTPTWREQFGHVLIEAMAARVPIVASDAGEIPYVVGEAGLVFKQKDVASLQICLEKLMRNADLRQQLVQKGYQRMVQEYTHKKIAGKTYQYWRELL